MTAWDNHPGVEVPCACGCGETVTNPDRRGRPRKFKRGHRLDHSSQIAANKRRTGSRHSEETKRVLSIAGSRPKPWLRGSGNGMSGRTGESNPNWKGGVTPERQALYASGEWKRVARLVRVRDGGCVVCGSTADTHVHHILSFAEHPELRLDPENLETRCPGHHYDAHRREVVS